MNEITQQRETRIAKARETERKRNAHDTSDKRYTRHAKLGVERRLARWRKRDMKRGVEETPEQRVNDANVRTPDYTRCSSPRRASCSY